MPPHILRTYALLAGEIQVAIAGPDGKSQVNVLSGVPYLQALGCHLWYLTDHSADLATALKLFSRNWHAKTPASAFSSTLEVAPPQPLSDAELICGKGDACAPEKATIGKLRSIVSAYLNPGGCWGEHNASSCGHHLYDVHQ